MSNTFVFDTNILIENPDILEEYDFDNENILVPMTVLEELDELKSQMSIVGFNARSVVQKLEQYGDRIKCPSVDLLKQLKTNNDNSILSVAKEYGGILVTNDVILKVKAIHKGVKYADPRVVIKGKKIYDGFRELIASQKLIDGFYEDGYILRDQISLDEELYPNEYVLLKSSDGSKQTVLGKKRKNKIIKINSNFKKRSVWGLEPRNLEQTLAFDALLDTNVQVVSLIGIAGSGKTVSALASGLSQIFSRGSHSQEYRKMIVARPIQTLGKDMGYLPGDLGEKLDPWLGPIYDNLDFLAGGDKGRVNGWFAKGKIEVEALAYIRGRTINKSFILIDEAQNLSPHEIKTILTRVGKGTKIVLTGDVEQIDNHRLTEYTNGLTYMIEKMKKYDMTSHITLTKGERSKVATVAAKAL